MVTQLVPVLAMINPGSVLVTALGLGLVIFFHELGHFLVAKWCGVYVERFSIGFGTPVISRKWGDTEYVIAWLPLGGYVKMRGQDDMDPGEMTDEVVAQDPRSYTAKSVPQRMAIISAGVIMNVITGLLFFMFAFKGGVETLENVVGDVKVGGPAWVAGLRSGDKILRINDHRINDFEELMVNTALSRGPLSVQGQHADGTDFNITMSAEALKSEQETRRKMGVTHILSLQLLGKEKPEELPLSLPGTAAAKADFQPGDRITAVDGEAVSTYNEFIAALSRKADQKVQLSVMRGSGEVEVSLLPHAGRDLGFRVSMGKVAALRIDGVAARAGIQVGDRISKVDGLLVENDLDPFRLTEYFSQHAGQEVVVTLSREAQGSDPTAIDVTVIPEDRPAWSEPPFTKDSPLSIPSIGLAYHIAPTVFSCNPEGPAGKLGIKKQDTITSVDLVLPAGERDWLGKSASLPEEIGEHNWAHVYWNLQTLGRSRQLKLTVLKAGGESKTVELETVSADDWYLQDARGIFFTPETKIRKAESVSDAAEMGATYTLNSIRQVYLTLRGLVLGDISITLMSGPIGIAQVAYQSAEMGFTRFLLFLGLISINLAVVNFLPIPVLDGGHMVLLLWEGVTRRKPNEKIVGILTWMGLCLLLTLIALVVFLDLFVTKA